LLTVFLIDHEDHAMAAAIEDIGVQVCVTDIVMKDKKDRVRLARESLAAVSPYINRMVGT
jgi:hypothetical protein